MKKIRRILLQLTYKHAVAIGLCLIIVGYAAFQFRAIVSGPSLSLSNPVAETVHSPLLTISGEAKRIARIYLNGTQIFTDEQGRFKEKLLLSRGYTILTLTATDKFGRQTEKQVQVVYN